MYSTPYRAFLHSSCRQDKFLLAVCSSIESTHRGNPSFVVDGLLHLSLIAVYVFLKGLYLLSPRCLRVAKVALAILTVPVHAHMFTPKPALSLLVSFVSLSTAGLPH